MATHTSPEQIICPGTGLPCGGKEFMLRMLRSLSFAQMGVDAYHTPQGLSSGEINAIKDKIIAEQDAKRAAIERDLQAHCSGLVCGPLAQTATRFILGGPSIGEANMFPQP